MSKNPAKKLQPRITSGTLKGRKIKVPKVENIRVPQDILKQAVFSIIGDKIKNAEVLDLFAGSGSFGLESISRDAKFVSFVEINKIAVEDLRKTVVEFDIESKAEVFYDESIKFIGNTDKTFDIIFVDPFYEDHKHRFLFQNLTEVLKNDGIIIFSHSVELNVQDQINGTDLKIVDYRHYGKAAVSFISKA